MFKYFIIATGLLIASTDTADYRPFISTQLAKAITLNSVVPDDSAPKKRCDGSGWIEHADGHKTPCPGCTACEGQDPQSGCDCGCGKPNCDCQSRSGSCGIKVDDQKLVADAKPKTKLLVYHMGADWCGPCVKLKDETWSNADLKKFMSDKGVELYEFDNENPEHQKFFEYYEISSLPTIIILKPDDLNNPRKSVIGFHDHEAMRALFEVELGK